VTVVWTTVSSLYRQAKGG